MTTSETLLNGYKRVVGIKSKIDITLPNVDNRPNVVGRIHKFDKMSIFTAEELPHIIRASDYLARSIHKKFGSKIAQLYNDRIATYGDVTSDMQYTVLVDVLVLELRILIEQMAASDNTLLIALALAWESTGDIGFNSAIQVFFISDNKDGIYSLSDNRNFSDTFSTTEDQDVENAVVHCPYHSFAKIFMNELYLALAQISIDPNTEFPVHQSNRLVAEFGNSIYAVARENDIDFS